MNTEKVETNTSCAICLSDIDENRQYKKICQEYNLICDECLDGWISSQIRLQNTNVKRDLVFLKCPFSDCVKLFDLSSFLSKVDITKIPQSNEVLFKNYCRETTCVTNCPNISCKNIGFLNPKETCRQSLQCDQCQYKWRLPSQRLPLEQFFLSIIGRNGNGQDPNGKKRLMVSLMQTIKEKYDEIKNFVYKGLFTKMCGNCGVYISRNGGCKQMRCERCYHHFCWDCGQTINYKHSANKCAIIHSIKLLILLSPVFAIYHKLNFFKFFKGIQFIASTPQNINSGFKFVKKLGNILLLFIRLCAYHAPLKIVYELLKSLVQKYPNLFKNLIPNLSTTPNREQNSTNQIQIIKWFSLLVANLLLLKYIGKGKEVLGIMGMESLFSIFMIANQQI